MPDHPELVQGRAGHPRSRRYLVLWGLGLFVIAALVGGWAGWYGSLVTCGADAAAVCVRWPGPVAALVWLAFLVLCFGLLAWQIMLWRESASDFRRDGPPE